MLSGIFTRGHKQSFDNEPLTAALRKYTEASEKYSSLSKNGAISKPHFDKSEIKPNKDIAKKSTWGKTEIEERQSDLAKKALEIWK